MHADCMLIAPLIRRVGQIFDSAEEAARAYGEKTAADAREEELLQLTSSIAAEEEDAANKLEASATIAAQVSDQH